MTVGGIDERFADVNGVRLHYLEAGAGDPVILLHGYAETSHMWRPIIGELSITHTVVAPDLRGFNQSSKPDAGYDKKTMAQDRVHRLVGIRVGAKTGRDHAGRHVDGNERGARHHGAARHRTYAVVIDPNGMMAGGSLLSSVNPQITFTLSWRAVASSWMSPFSCRSTGGGM
jgi:hypothetical protein